MRWAVAVIGGVAVAVVGARFSKLFHVMMFMYDSRDFNPKGTASCHFLSKLDLNSNSRGTIGIAVSLGYRDGANT